jgi:Uma2 family endonuclease
MLDVGRITVEEFFAWQALVEGRYELVDGHITPHPDYVTPQGFAAPDNDHGTIVGNIVSILRSQLHPPCRVYVGSGAVIDRVNANIPDLAVSCLDADRSGMALREPRFVFEVSSPRTARIDTGRKVEEYLAIGTLEAYAFGDRKRRTITVYRPDTGPQTIDAGVVVLADALRLPLDDVFA